MSAPIRKNAALNLRVKVEPAKRGIRHIGQSPSLFVTPYPPEIKAVMNGKYTSSTSTIQKSLLVKAPNLGTLNFQPATRGTLTNLTHEGHDEICGISAPLKDEAGYDGDISASLHSYGGNDAPISATIISLVSTPFAASPKSSYVPASPSYKSLTTYDSLTSPSYAPYSPTYSELLASEIDTDRLAAEETVVWEQAGQNGVMFDGFARHTVPAMPIETLPSPAVTPPSDAHTSSKRRREDDASSPQPLKRHKAANGEFHHGSPKPASTLPSWSMFYEPPTPKHQKMHPSALKRVCQAVLTQVNWDDVKEYAGGEFEPAEYRDTFTSLLQEKMEEIVRERPDDDDE